MTDSIAKELLVIVLLIIGVFSILIWAIYGISLVMCANTSEKMGYEYSYSMKTDCMIKVDGHWIPMDSLRVLK
jgi:hypothetical protein